MKSNNCIFVVFILLCVFTFDAETGASTTRATWRCTACYTFVQVAWREPLPCGQTRNKLHQANIQPVAIFVDAGIYRRPIFRAGTVVDDGCLIFRGVAISWKCQFEPGIRQSAYPLPAAGNPVLWFHMSRVLAHITPIERQVVFHTVSNCAQAIVLRHLFHQKWLFAECSLDLKNVPCRLMRSKPSC